MDFVRCPHCGTSIHPIASRCKYCRGDVRGYATTIEASPIATPARGTGLATVFIVTAVAAIALAVVRFSVTRENVAAAAVTRQAPKPSPFANVAGRWHGVGHQYDPDTHWDIVMTIEPGDAAPGERVGTIDYPTLGCSGEIVRESEALGEFIVREHITNNPDARCVSTGLIRFALKDNKLDWKWFFTKGGEAASARLVR